MLPLARLAVVLALAVPTTAAAAPARPPLHRTALAPVTDGRSLSVWADGGEDSSTAAFVLRDDQPRDATPATVPLPSSCLFGAVSAAAIGLLCFSPGVYGPDQLVRIDLATGARTTIDVGEHTHFDANGEFYYLGGLGTGVADVRVMGFHESSIDAIRLDGGGLVDPHPTPRTVFDLDAPTGRTTLCAPLRVGSVVGRRTHRRVFDAVAYRAPWLLARHRGHARLARCGGPRVRDLGPASDGPLVVTARYAAWTLGREVLVRRLRDGATFRYTIPGGHPPRLAATDRRLWIAGTHHYVVEP
jgi:hypothetical protein